MPYERNCIYCKKKIKECIGYVLARDFIELLNKPGKEVRELCGLCIERIELKMIRLEEIFR